MSRRRQGMFAHARYSEKVFRNLPPKIAEGVQRDIAYILKKDKPTDVQKWNRALPSQSEIDQHNEDDYFQSHANDGAASSSSYQASRPQQQRRPRRNVNPKPLDLRSEFMSARELFNKEYHSTEESIIPSRVLRSSSSSTHYQTTKDETPTAFRTPANAPAHKRSKRIPGTGDAAVAAENEKVFPANGDPNLIAERIRKGLPYLPLRRGDATSYKDAITEILKETIGAFLQPTGDGQASVGSSVRRRQTTVDEYIDPFDALMNKTSVINLSRSSFGQSARNDESPSMSINELSHLRQGVLNQSYVNEVNENPISGAFLGNIPSPHSESNFMGDYDRDIEEIIDSNNIPGSNELDQLAIKAPSVYSQPSVRSLKHRSTLRTPSISETFNNLSNQDLNFDPQNSSEFGDFKLSFNPSNFTQTLPASSGFLNSTFAPRHDSINATFLQPLRSAHVPRQASRNNAPFLQPPPSRQSSRSSRISGLHSRISKAKKRKVEEEENSDTDEAFFRF